MASSDVIRPQSVTPRCDGCGRKGEPVAFAEIRSHIGRRCPACDAVMVTEQDCEVVEATLALVAKLNELAAASDIDMTGAGQADLRISTKNGGEFVSLIARSPE